MGRFLRLLDTGKEPFLEGLYLSEDTLKDGIYKNPYSWGTLNDSFLQIELLQRKTMIMRWKHKITLQMKSLL